MRQIGFWQLLLDNRLSYWEAQRINEAYEDSESAYQNAADAQRAAASAATRIDMMSREIVMLRTALTVLTQTLKDAKLVDEKLLDARLEAAMDEAFPKPEAKAPAVPAAEIPYTCLRCRKQVAAGTTIMTADGPVCERRCAS
jgi:hypothetical protein